LAQKLYRTTAKGWFTNMIIDWNIISYFSLFSMVNIFFVFIVVLLAFKINKPKEEKKDEIKEIVETVGDLETQIKEHLKDTGK